MHTSLDIQTNEVLDLMLLSSLVIRFRVVTSLSSSSELMTACSRMGAALATACLTSE